MQRSDRWPEEYDPADQRSRPASRRNSATSRRGSIKENTAKSSPLNSAPNSNNSTPKRVVKPQNLDFIITGKQIVKRGDRANSLPGSCHRRPSTESIANKIKKPFDSPKRVANVSMKSHENSLEDDMSLDLSQVSDFEDTNSKYGFTKKFTALATSTPKPQKSAQKSRSCSLQSQIHSQKVESRRNQKSLDSSKQSRDSRDSCSRDSLYKTSSSTSNYRYPTELDYSSVSPEYSGQSSTDLSPRTRPDQVNTPLSQDMQVSSSCVSTWQDCSELENTKVQEFIKGEGGEWNDFWANYNNSIAKVPMKNYYDQCPTPYRTENIDLADFDFSTESSRKRSPDNTRHLNDIIRNEGLHLTARETQNIIKCAHILGNVLTKAIERNTKEKDIVNKVNEPKNETEDPELEEKKKTLTLDLKETNIPVEVQEEKRSETVTTQTDISLPNTKSAPRIFENILRQLSRSSIEVPAGVLKKEGDVDKKETNAEKKEVNIDKKEANIEKKEANIDKKEANIEKKEANIDKKEANTEKNEDNIEKKEVNIDKKEEGKQVENSIEKIKDEVENHKDEVEKVVEKED